MTPPYVGPIPANKNGYARVTFYDKSNGTKKTYNVPINTTVGLEKEGSERTITKDTTIEVRLPHMAAVSAWDANKDQCLDDKDVLEITKREEKYPGNSKDYQCCYLGEKIDGSLKASKSEFRVEQAPFHYSAHVDEQGFLTAFDNKYRSEEGYERKLIYLETPKQQEYNEIRKEEERKLNEAYNAKIEAEYKKEHPILSFFGVDRNLYHKFFK